jgi:hypothetical protein
MPYISNLTENKPRESMSELRTGGMNAGSYVENEI